MAAPGPTARSTPTGIPLRDGFATMITLANEPAINLWEKATTPPGKENGDPIDLTTFHNVARRTKWPRVLIEDTDSAMTCAYDPEVEADLEAQVGLNQEITVTWNDGSTKAYWGYMKSFNPQEVSNGEQPEASCEFVVTNLDNSFAEQAPVVSEVSGT